MVANNNPPIMEAAKEPNMASGKSGIIPKIVVSEAAIGSRLTIRIRKESREISSWDIERSISGAIKPRSASDEVREEVSFVAIHRVVSCLSLLGSSYHAFVVVQCQLAALVKSKKYLCMESDRTEKQ